MDPISEKAACQLGIHSYHSQALPMCSEHSSILVTALKGKKILLSQAVLWEQVFYNCSNPKNLEKWKFSNLHGKSRIISIPATLVFNY